MITMQVVASKRLLALLAPRVCSTAAHYSVIIVPGGCTGSMTSTELVNDDVDELHKRMGVPSPVTKTPAQARVLAQRARKKERGAKRVSRFSLPNYSVTQTASFAADASQMSKNNPEGGEKEPSCTEDLAQTVLEKGGKKLMDTEDGRQVLRDGSFNLDGTAQAMMQAAHEELGGGGGAPGGQSEGEKGREEGDKGPAEAIKEAMETSAGGSKSKLTDRVKEHVISMSEAS